MLLKPKVTYYSYWKYVVCADSMTKQLVVMLVSLYRSLKIESVIYFYQTQNRHLISRGGRIGRWDLHKLSDMIVNKSLLVTFVGV